MPLTVPVLCVLEFCRGERTTGPLILRPLSGRPIDGRDVYRMVQRIAKTAGIPRHISPHSLRHAAITNALDAGVPLRDAQILARHADPRTTEHYDRARGNLDRHGDHFLTAYVAGVQPVQARRVCVDSTHYDAGRDGRRRRVDPHISADVRRPLIRVMHVIIRTCRYADIFSITALGGGTYRLMCDTSDGHGNGPR